jgi:cystathionine beta-lyase/cystathionine gamma-synthase
MNDKKKLMNQPESGIHGITGTMDTVQINIDFEEGKLELDRGYVRFVIHPFVRQLEQQIATRYQAPKALSFHSVESACFVLLDAMYKTGINGIYSNNPMIEAMGRFLKTTSGLDIPFMNAAIADIIFEDLTAPVDEKNPQRKYQIGIHLAGELPSYINQNTYDAIITTYPNNNTGFIIFYNTEFGKDVELLRRHTGFNLNSRKAGRLLKQQTDPVDFNYTELKDKLAILEKGEPENIFLYPTGMGAISTAILSLLTPDRPKMVMIGSPYVDTRCILEKWPARRGTTPAVFLEVDDPDGIARAIDHQTALVICEIPTNPLIRVPDLEKVVEIAHQHGALVLVDNTIASPFNLNPFDYAVDIIAHSTTKSLNGMNDHIGGVVLARDKQIAHKISTFNSLLNLNMDPEDAAVLNQNLNTFTSRMKTMNRNAQKLAEYLDAHPKVKKVWYSGLPNHPDHEIARRYLKGCSTLLSFLLAGDAEQNTRKFFDNIGAPIVKAPSLGGSQSLLCLYVILAHYFDSPEKLAQMGLEKYLLRISVGTENIDKIIEAFEKAFALVEVE